MLHPPSSGPPSGPSAQGRTSLGLSDTAGEELPRTRLSAPARVGLQPPGVEPTVVLIDQGSRRDELVDRIEDRRLQPDVGAGHEVVELLARPRTEDRGRPGRV